MNAFGKIKNRVRLPRRAMSLAISLGLLLLLIPASTPYGAGPFTPPCAADPPPAAVWGVVWFPQETDYALQAGRELLARPDYPAALCYLKLAADAQSADPQFQADLGEAYRGTGDEQEAFAAWERALQSDPGLDEISERLWKGYVAAGRWDDAERAIERWLSRGADPEAEYRLALIRAARNPGSALELLDGLKSAPAPYAENARALAAVIRAAVARRVPEYIFAKTGEGLLRLGEPRLAKVVLQLAIERNPEYGEAFALLGLAQESSGEDPEASYRRGVALAPNSATACLVYGAWLRRLGELTLARWWLSQAWAAQPGDWTIAAELAQVDFAAGNVGQAEAWVVEAVQIHPEEEGAWLALAAFYIENDYRVEANGIPAARQAVLLAPDSDRALDMLGLGWYKMGDFSMAERLFLRALDENPDSASVHLHLGLCYAEQGRAAEARAEWEAALGLDANGSVGARAKELLEG
jgi:Tfp pilus assembly protein PilF